MVEHNLHVLVRKAKVQQRHCTLNFGLTILVVKHLQVVVHIVDVYFVKVNLRTLTLLNTAAARRPVK